MRWIRLCFSIQIDRLDLTDAVLHALQLLIELNLIREQKHFCLPITALIISSTSAQSHPVNTQFLWSSVKTSKSSLENCTAEIKRNVTSLLSASVRSSVRCWNINNLLIIRKVGDIAGSETERSRPHGSERIQREGKMRLNLALYCPSLEILLTADCSAPFKASTVLSLPTSAYILIKSRNKLH